MALEGALFVLTGLHLMCDGKFVPAVLYQWVTSLRRRVHQTQLCFNVGRLLSIGQIVPRFALVKLRTGPRNDGIDLSGPQRRGKCQRQAHV